MARHFTRASAERVQLPIGAASVEVFGPYTCVVVARRASDVGFMQMLTAQNTVPNNVWGFLMADNDTLQVSVATDRNSTFTTLSSEGWLLVAVQKATGTATPRFHKYVYSTNTWTHQNASNGTQANITAPGAGDWRIGSAQGFTDDFDGDIAAVMYFPRVCTDSEIEKMAAGNWWRWTPRFHREFRSGEDQIGRGRQIGRDATNDSVLVGTTRSFVRDPPGFAFSPMTPRR